ncbi:MAG: hypothetical protein HY903_21475 [Deltaproteobacteria bacterium]|nr:hypothetical protein [Deltaproteobacteria bacterium]
MSATRGDEMPSGEETAAVDLTLIDAVLALSPAERLELNDRMATMAEELRAGFAVAEDHD